MDCDFFMTYTFETKLIRIIDDILIPSDFTMTAHLNRADDVSDHAIEVGINKCRYWFDNIVTRAIAFSYSNTMATDMLIDDEGLPRSSNSFMMVPDEPRDEMLAAVFQSKMNALSNGAFTVEAIDISSSNLNGLSFTLAGDHSEYLPKTMDEWLQGPSYFDVPWWMRDDASTFDAYCMDEEKRDIRPSWAFALDFLDKSKSAKPVDGPNIVKPEFKPKIIICTDPENT